MYRSVLGAEILSEANRAACLSVLAVLLWVEDAVCAFLSFISQVVESEKKV